MSELEEYQCPGCGSAAAYPGTCTSCGSLLVPSRIADLDLSALGPRVNPSGSIAKIVSGVLCFLFLVPLLITVLLGNNSVVLAPALAILLLMAGASLAVAYGHRPRQTSRPDFDELRTRILQVPIREVQPGLQRVLGTARFPSRGSKTPKHFSVVGDDGSVIVATSRLFVEDEKRIHNGDEVEVIGVALPSKSTAPTSADYRTAGATMEFAGYDGVPVRARVLRSGERSVRMRVQDEDEASANTEVEVERDDAKERTKASRRGEREAAAASAADMTHLIASRDASCLFASGYRLGLWE